MKMNAHNDTLKRGIHPELEGKSTHRSRPPRTVPRPPSSVIRSFHSGPRPHPPRRPHPPLLVSSSSSYLILALALSALLSPPPSAASLPKGPCQYSLLPPLPPPPAAPFLCLISLSSSSSLFSSSQSEGAVLGVTLWPLVLLSAPTTAFPLPLPPLASPTTALPSNCAHHGVPSATLGLALDLGGAHTTPHHGACDSALAPTTALPTLPLTMALTTALWRGRRRRGGRCLAGAHGMHMTARGMPSCCSQTSIDGPKSALAPDGAGGA